MDSPLHRQEQLVAAMFEAHEQQALTTVIELGQHALRHELACEATELLLAVAQQASGQLDEAIAGFQRMVGQWPDVPSYWNNLGVVQRQAGDFAGAEQAFQHALQLQPDDGELHYNLGLLYLEHRHLLLARGHLLQAAEALPEENEVCLQAAYACYLCGDTGQQTKLLAHVEQWPPQGVEPALLLASMLGSEGRGELALEVIERALGLPDGRHGPGWLRLSIQRAALLERSNAVAAAQQHLQQIRGALQGGLATAAPELRRELAQLEAALALRQQDHQAAITHYQQAAEHGAGDPGSFAAIHFGLARTWDRLNQPAKALHHAGLAHAAQAEQASALMPELLLPGTAPLLLAEARISATDYRCWSPAPPAQHPSPVFIVGFPRSGTTLLEQMLDAHPAYQSMDERPFVHELTQRMEAVGQRYPEGLAALDDREIEQLRAVYWGLVDRTVRLSPGQRLVDKNPLNMLALPMIMRLFPDAQVILCLRHPLDVLLSCYLQTFRSPAFMLMCSDIRRLARAYRQAFEHWLEQAAILAPRVLPWRYETVVEDFSSQCRALADFLQLGDASALAGFAGHAERKGFISTPSYAQVTEGIYQRGVGRWQAYRSFFEPVLPELSPLIERLGYAW
ncbi:sulfotransferase family protein [Frateuria aurantia]